MDLRRLCSIVVLLPLACHAPQADRPAPPNIVFVMVDDLGWSDTSVAMGAQASAVNRRYHTPNLERLAREGLRFSRAYASAPVCTPTRASLMTGLEPLHNGITYWTLWADRRTDGADETLQPPEWNWAALSPDAGVPHTFHATQPLAQLLRRAGYRTIHAGKWHLGGKQSPGEDPRALGFDVNIAGHAAGAPGSYLATDDYGAQRDGDHVWDVPGLEKYHGSDVFLTDAITREALGEVEHSVADRQRFFLYLAHYAIHVPHDQDARFYARYRAEGLNDAQARYAALVEGVDSSLGEVYACLERLGVLENTLIVFTSDNGGLSARGPQALEYDQNLPLKSGKGSAYEGGIRVPAIVRWPGVTRAASSSDAPISTQDWYPTLLGIAGAEETPASDGADLRRLLAGGAAPAERAFTFHFPHTWGPKGPGLEPFSAIVRGDWKLIYFHAGARFELYDVAHDPGETRELSAERPEIARNLRDALRAELAGSLVDMPTRRDTGARVERP